jgi:DNA-binding SARP family transcriptional activator
MDDETKIVVDYRILAPFGLITKRAGPFDTDSDADKFVAQLRELYSEWKLEVSLQRVPVEKDHQ